METPVHPARPGMPEITAIPEPQAVSDHPENPNPQPGETGVGDASADSGAAFVRDLFGGGGEPPPGAVVPPTSPVVPQPKSGPAPVPQNPAEPQNRQPQPPAQPEGQPQNLDFGGRYGAETQDPAAGLESLPELPADQPVATPQNLDEKQNHAFAGMRAQLGAMRRVAEDYRNKYNGVVEEFKKFQSEKTAFAEQLNQKDARIKQLEDDIGRADLSKSPEFREKYDAPITKIRDDVSGILVANGLDSEQASALAEQILTAEPGKVPELISQLPTHVQGMIMIHSQNADRLWGERDAALENWRQSAEGLAATASRGSAIIAAQKIDQLANRAIQIVKSLPVNKGSVPAFQVTDPTFAADRDAKERQFLAWVHQAPEEQKYAAMFEGFMAPKTYEMLQQTWVENQQLKEFIATRGRIATPPIAATRGAAPAPATSPAPTTPTVSADGYSPAEGGVDAQGFARGLISEMLSGGDAGSRPLV